MLSQTESPIKQGQTETVLNISDLRLWSPSDPFLYDLQLQLIDSSGEVVDVVDSYFGQEKSPVNLIEVVIRGFSSMVNLFST